MMRAAIYNADFSPLTEEVEVHSDQEFEAIEAEAADLAAQGKRCCIRWARDSDGQAAYWGPNGATLQPHWYNKTGRPAKAPGEKMIPVPVRLTPAQRDKLQRIGVQRLRDWLDRTKE